MKFAFFGYDYSLGTAQALIADGHTLGAVFTFPCDRMFTFNDRLKALAKDVNAPVTEEKATPAQIASCLDSDCTLFVSAGYPYKIPPIDEKDAYALNIHPSLLPRARGIMPLPHILLNEPEAAGFTIHKMTQDFDAGDILYQEAIRITADTDIEILSAQIAMRSPGAAVETVRNLARLWKNARLQDESQASTCPPPGEEMRMIYWTDGIEKTNAKSKAFGRFGVTAKINTDRFVCFNLKGWHEKHANTPGDVLLADQREIVVAAADGFVCLKEFQKLAGPV